MSWTREQRNVTIAAYLGWTLDAFDFFLMVFVLKDIAAEFNTTIPAVAVCDYVDLDDAPGRRADFRLARRQVRPASDADARHRVLSRCSNCCPVRRRT